MKKNILQRTLFTTLTILSLVAYTYLNTIASKNVISDKTVVEMTETETQILPDVHAVKKAFEIASKFLPALSE